jgi:hypothetical protein
MLCENCHQHEATCHITTIDGDIMECRHLCTECHQAGSPEAAQRNAHCEYCGGQPCVSGADFHAMLTGGRKLKVMCIPCSLEHIKYAQQHLPQLQTAMELSQQERLTLVERLDQEADRHMQQWVSDRNSR